MGQHPPGATKLALPNSCTRSRTAACCHCLRRGVGVGACAMRCRRLGTACFESWGDAHGCRSSRACAACVPRVQCTLHGACTCSSTLGASHWAPPVSSPEHLARRRRNPDLKVGQRLLSTYSAGKNSGEVTFDTLSKDRKDRQSQTRPTAHRQGCAAALQPPSLQGHLAPPARLHCP